ncbi:MAG: hypothetical protein IPI46_00750 [Bacteroidetes bacterium]|nr:hypothetical protein [Bacteroidota bacterium]
MNNQTSIRQLLCSSNSILSHQLICKLAFTFLSIFAYSLMSISARCQAPQSIPYQAVARNASGDLLASQNISLRFSVRNANATGTIVYQETQTATTNSLGLFSVNLGQGTPTIGTVSAIDWANGSKFIQVELDPNGGTSYTNMGTTQLMSVPYALNAASSNDNKWLSNGNNISNANSGNVGIGINAPGAILHVNDVNGIQNAPSADLVLSRVWNNPSDTRASSVFHFYNTATGNDNLGFGISGGGSTNDAPNSLSQIKMMIQGNGNVGIGTILPESKLSIVDALNNSALHASIDGGDALLQLKSPANNYWTRIGSSQSPLAILTQGNDKYSPYPTMFLNNDGNIGIGTSAPTNRLTVAGSANAIGQIISNTSGHGLVQTDGTTSVGTYADGTAGWIGTNSNHPLYFYTANGWESMMISTSGNVGLGTSSPNEKLSVVGTTGLYGNSIFSPNQSGANGTVSIGTPTIFANSMLNVKSNLQYGAFIDAPSSSEALHVEGMTRINGEVGIGIAPSSVYLLAVGGKIICTELRVQATPFPDYVFDASYNLKPLEEVEQHILTHHRLPNMPPATEVESDGMNVGGIQLKLVEKVEELTLYLLQQQKELKAQKQEIEQLRTQLNTSKN